ncbi:fumarylacetoacetate hydrolase family protein [Gordonia asplenii]|uniref:fumarylacetoacetate hydrolase family protein n=1 Tax=Gordonia asplenii TaxID=2725283 RepID=UPI0028AAB6B1|nr:fumarylacetoacetate hydrolase family protein [Gordonia asplenii]
MVTQDDLVHGLEPGRSLLDVLRSDTGLAGHVREVLDDPQHVAALDEVHICGLLQPPSIRDYLGFLDHFRAGAQVEGIVVDPRIEQIPAFYFSSPATILGPTDDVAIFPGSQRFDFELEVAAVIGTPGRNISRHDALNHIAGYTIFCDWSARDLQAVELPIGTGPAKSKDGAQTLGPFLVTPDEIESYRAGKGFALQMTASVNGEQVSSGRWDSIDWDFADMIAYASRGADLRAGDVLGTGTVPTGCLVEAFAADPDGFRGWLQPGDRVELAVERLGSTRQQVTAAEPVEPLSTGF